MPRTAAGIPASIVPVRYAVTFADASTPVAWPGLNGPTRAELAPWIADRALDEYRRQGMTRDDAWQAARRYAAAQLGLAEAYGSTELFAWSTDVSAILEAWQAPTTQGQADALAAFLAAAERHGLTAAELADGIATAEAEAELMQAATLADGEGTLAVAGGPLTDWELELIAEHTLADLALSDPAGVAVRAHLAAKAADAKLERQAAANAAELEADAAARRAAYAAELAAEAAAELEAAKAADQDRAEADECSHPAELADPGMPRMVCAVCGAFRRWTTPAPTEAELEGMRRALDAVAADLNGAILPAELGAPAELEATLTPAEAELAAAARTERAAIRANLAAELRGHTEPADSPTALTDAELDLAMTPEAEATGHAADAATAKRYAEADAWRALILAAGIASSARRTYARTGARYARDAAAEAVTARRIATRKLAAILIGGHR